VRDHLVRTHPLQPFSPRLFDPEAPRSYDRRMGIAAARLVGGRLANTPPLFTQPLPPPVDTGVGLSVSLRDLVRFFELPVKFLLQRRLGIYLGTDAAGLDDREPVELDSLQTWGLGDGILTRRLAGQTEAVAHAAMRASGQLPPGTLGQVAFETVAQRAVDILERTRARQVGEARAVLLDSLLDLQDFGSVRVAGTLDPVWADGLVTYRFGKVRAKHEIGAWIRHLALQLAEPAGQHVTAFLGEAHGNDPGEVVFPPLAVEVAREHLTGLVRLFLLGQQVPLAWFPSTSRDYASKWHDPRYEGDDAKTIAACKAAQQKWNPQGPGAIGDVDDAHTALVFTDLEPFRASTPLPAGAEQNGLDFHTLALAVWTPVLQARAAMEAA
jgi:exodeoxyribonuclease V gamma subunit